MRLIKKLLFVLTLLSGISITAYSQSDLVSWKLPPRLLITPLILK